MKFTIVTPTFNSAATIRDTLESIRMQDYPDLEHIIIDGGSKDDTLNIVAEYSHVGKVVSEPDRGLYDAMNKGVSMATGDIVGILNSDDFYADSHVISDVVQKFQAENCDGLYADLVYVDREKLDKVIRVWNAGPYFTGRFLK